MSLAYPNPIREQLELIKRTVAKGCTDLELELFIKQCERTGLDPFARQIYAVKRWDAQARTEVMQTQVSIDGLRSIADETGEMGGQDGPFWCGPDGQWASVWTKAEDPVAARVMVIRRKLISETVWSEAEFSGVARWDSYCQTTKEGKPTKMWAQMGPEMLAKCAEALALRKAFPQRLSGLYSGDEMGQASNPSPERGNSHERPPERPVSASSPVRPVSPILPPPRPAEGKLEASDGSGGAPSGPAEALKSDPLGPMRSRVSLSLGRLSMDNRSAVLAKGDAERLQLPEEQGFTADHANRWLELVKGVDAP